MKWEKSKSKAIKGWTFGVINADNAVAYVQERGEWRVVWLALGMVSAEDDVFPFADYTEEELREVIVLKYKLLKGEYRERGH